MSASMVLPTANTMTATPALPTVRRRLISHVDAALVCRVSPQMVLQWVETGAWPLPQSVWRKRLYFQSLNVEAWVETGLWPENSRFHHRGGPGEGFARCPTANRPQG